MAKIKNQDLKQELLNNKVCFTTEGKYIVDGKEISIDTNIDEIPLAVLKKLEANPMTQLDALYVRKKINQMSNSFNEIAKSIDEKVDRLDKRVDETEQKIELFTEREFECQAKKVPEIAETVVHKIVNGKFEKISTSLENISVEQLKAKQELIKYKNFQMNQHDILVQKIEYVAEKTIFGWIKKQYEKRPFRTLLIAGIVFIVSFLYFMNTLGFKSFNDMLNWLIGWFK